MGIRKAKEKSFELNAFLMINNSRVCTEIGNQNSRTFPGLFKDYLHFFQESFFIDGNSLNTAYTQDFCPIQDRKRISLSGSLFLPDFSSAYSLRNITPDFLKSRKYWPLHRDYLSNSYLIT